MLEMNRDARAQPASSFPVTSPIHATQPPAANPEKGGNVPVLQSKGLKGPFPASHVGWERSQDSSGSASTRLRHVPTPRSRPLRHGRGGSGRRGQLLPAQLEPPKSEPLLSAAFYRAIKPRACQMLAGISPCHLHHHLPDHSITSKTAT